MKKSVATLEAVVDNVRDYHSHEEMMETIDKMAAEYPHLLKR